MNNNNSNSFNVENKKKKVRRSKKQVAEITEKIFNLLCKGESDKYIQQKLGLKQRNYYKYKQKLFSKYEDLQRKRTQETIWFETYLLKNRLLKIFQTILQTIESKPTKMNGIQLAKLAQTAASISTILFKLETQGIIQVLKDKGVEHKHLQRLVDMDFMSL